MRLRKFGFIKGVSLVSVIGLYLALLVGAFGVASAIFLTLRGVKLI